MRANSGQAAWCPYSEMQVTFLTPDPAEEVTLCVTIATFIVSLSVLVHVMGGLRSKQVPPTIQAIPSFFSL
jgi:hypothetical protein